jgi:mono/diheme cytochrome c family protein
MRTLLATAAAAVVAAPASGAAPPSAARGKTLFVAACGSCHRLGAAGTHGRKGPDLGQEAASYGDVVDQVVNGGGGMPAFGKSLTRKQIHDIAFFVARATAGAHGD